MKSVLLKLVRHMKAGDTHGNIIVTHIYIRQSIALLLSKIILLDMLAVVLVSFTFGSLFQFSPNTDVTAKVISYSVFFFVLLGLVKILFTVIIILMWLNEYYEIWPEKIVHKKGVIWRREQKYVLKYVRTVKLNQGAYGRIFNYGTIRVFDIRRNDVFDLYLIHDPHRYMRIIESLVGNTHEEKTTLSGHLFAEDIDEDVREDIGDDW